MKLRQLMVEDAKKEIYQILEASISKESGEFEKYLLGERPFKGRVIGRPAEEDELDKEENKKYDMEQNKWTLLPNLSKQDNKRLIKQIRLLKLLGDKKGLEQALSSINQRRREHNYPQLTPDGLKIILARVKNMPPFTRGEDVDRDFDWKKHKKDEFKKSDIIGK
jgi:hypothetical protein